MKTRSFIPVFLLLAILMMFPGSVLAQVTTPPGIRAAAPAAAGITLEGEDVYTFGSLGYPDQVMNGPYDYFRYRFPVPATWSLKYGTSVQVNIRTIVSSSKPVSEAELIRATGATLDVQFNGKWVTTLVLDWVGDRTVTIPIPFEALPSPTGQYTLSFYLDASIDCEYDHQTTVVISSESVIDLPHEVASPKLDLTLFPLPFYQGSSVLPLKSTGETASPSVFNTAFLVIPDNPSPAELQAALTVSAGLGYLTGGNLVVETLPVSSLTTKNQSRANLIFVGNGPGLEPLQEASLPAPYDGKKFSVKGSEADDGLIQIGVSPWNPANVLMVVSGTSDAGLIKAAQAVSSGTIRVTERKDLSIVREVTPDVSGINVPVDRTFADLGFQTIQMGGLRYNPADYLDIQFFIPPGQTVEGEAYLDLAYSSSPILNKDLSGLSIYLNGTAIGGSSYSDESTQSVAFQRFLIPDFLLIPGVNLLTIEVNNHPEVYCSDWMYSNTWTTLYNQSLLHIPLAASEEKATGLRTLANILDFMTASPTLDKLAFIVSPESPSTVVAASKLAFEIGTRITGDFVEMKAVYADAVPEELYKGHDLILLGKATEIPLLGELEEVLPAPFEAGSNVARETVFRVVYRVPEDTQVGYLELVESPRDTSRAILAVLGTTDGGVQDATNSLTIPELRNKLAGNFAVVGGSQVISSDTRYGIGTGNMTATLVPEVTPEVMAATPEPPVTVGGITAPGQKGWILPAVGVLTGLIVLVLVVVVVSSKKNT